MRLYLALVVLALALGSDVLNLNEENFDSIKDKKVVLVEFFAPWCGHCQQLAPKWEIAATKLKESAVFAKVDCTSSSSEALCTKHGIEGYPTIKVFRDGELAEEYDGELSVEGFASYLSGDSTNDDTANVADLVVVLTADNFEKYVSQKHFFVEFYAPWCGHCKTLEPLWKKAAFQLSQTQPEGSPPLLGKLDATVHTELAATYGVEAYPNIMAFKDGIAVDQYEGGGTISELLEYFESMMQPTWVDLTTLEEAEKFVSDYESKPSIGFFDNLDSEEDALYRTLTLELAHQGFAFARTTSAEIKAKFDITESSLVAYPNANEAIKYPGKLTEDEGRQMWTWAVVSFFPLVTDININHAESLVVGLPLVIFFYAGDEDSKTKTLAVANEVCQPLRLAVVCVIANGVDKVIADTLNITPQQLPTVVIDEMAGMNEHFPLRDKFSAEAVTQLVDDFFNGKLTPTQGGVDSLEEDAAEEAAEVDDPAKNMEDSPPQELSGDAAKLTVLTDETVDDHVMLGLHAVLIVDTGTEYLNQYVALFAKLEKTFEEKKVQFSRLDVEKTKDFIYRARLHSIPAIIIVRDGIRAKEIYTGEAQEESIQAWIEAFVKPGWNQIPEKVVLDAYLKDTVDETNVVVNWPPSEVGNDNWDEFKRMTMRQQSRANFVILQEDITKPSLEMHRPGLTAADMPAKFTGPWEEATLDAWFETSLRGLVSELNEGNAYELSKADLPFAVCLFENGAEQAAKDVLMTVAPKYYSKALFAIASAEVFAKKMETLGLQISDLPVVIFDNLDDTMPTKFTGPFDAKAMSEALDSFLEVAANGISEPMPSPELNNAAVVKSVVRDSFAVQVLAEAKPVLVQAVSSTCLPCQEFSADYERVGQSLPDLVVTKINAELNTLPRPLQEGTGFPRFFLFRSGPKKEYDFVSYHGSLNFNSIVEWLSSEDESLRDSSADPAKKIEL